MRNHETFKKLVMETSKEKISTTDRNSTAFSVASITRFHQIFELEDEEIQYFLRAWKKAGEETDDPHIRFIVDIGQKALEQRRSIDELGELGSGN